MLFLFSLLMLLDSNALASCRNLNSDLPMLVEAELSHILGRYKLEVTPPTVFVDARDMKFNWKSFNNSVPEAEFALDDLYNSSIGRDSCVNEVRLYLKGFYGTKYEATCLIRFVRTDANEFFFNLSACSEFTENQKLAKILNAIETRP